MHRVWTALCHLICGFWKVDRIRVSPREGLLLRLSNQSIVVIDQKPLQIKTRKVIAAGESVCVEYGCDGEDGPSLLRVIQSGLDLQPEVQWETGNGCNRYRPDQLEVYGEV